MMERVYSDEDNEPMNETFLIEYIGIINDRLFKQTGECVVKKTLYIKEREEK